MSDAGATLLARLADLATLGARDTGISRPLFSAAEFAARERFVSWARAAGFTLTQDVAGNVFARRPGVVTDVERAPILMGSHLDTVDGGGAYDGAYGVVAALTVLEALEASGAQTEHPIEAVAWAGEEGSRFPLGCLGSGAYAGLNTLTDLDALGANDDGEPFPIARAGRHGLVPGVAVRQTFPRPAAYLELHIEQGPLLETAGEVLGVVTAIAGARRFRVSCTGERGHAGTLPMTLRKDALCAAADVVLALEAAAREVGNCVATVGNLAVEPNETNVVPGAVTLRVDMRSVDDERIDRLERALNDACERTSRERGVAVAIVPLERRVAVPMDPRLRASLHATIERANARAIDVPSGAGHDAMCLAAVTPTAMLFVPSAGGRSHVGDEYTSPADLVRGADMLVRALIDVDRLLATPVPAE